MGEMWAITLMLVTGIFLATIGISKTKISSVSYLGGALVALSLCCAGYMAFTDYKEKNWRVTLPTPVTHASSPDLYVECVNGYQFVKHSRGGVAQFFIQTEGGMSFKPALCEPQPPSSK